jgi:hypothetical protein
MSAINTSKSDPVCVLGFGRSGTSLTMRLLNLIGVALGPEEDLLRPVEADNTRGYWEPQWMVDLNDEILAELDTVWWRPLPAEPGWERREAFDPLRERARALLQEKFGAAPLWGWKDARMALTLPFWQELVPDAKYVICVRNPADAISSIQRRPEPTMSVDAWGDVWLEHIARALMETDGRPRLLVFYEDFFRDPCLELERMASFLGVQPPELDEPGSSLLGEIAPELRHHSTSSLELAATSGIPPAARIVFLGLRAARDLRDKDSHLNGHAEHMADAFARVTPELWWERRSLSDLRTVFAEAQQTTAGLQEEQRELTAASTQAREECTELRALLEREREQFHDELGSAHTELSRTSEEARASAARCGGAQAALSELEDQLERQRAVLVAVQSSVSWRLTAPLRALKRMVRRVVASVR